MPQIEALCYPTWDTSLMWLRFAFIPAIVTRKKNVRTGGAIT